MTTKFSKFGIDVEVIQKENSKYTIKVDFSDNDILFQHDFYSEGEALSFASDFLDDLKGMFKPYIMSEIEAIKNKDQTEFFN